MGRSGSSGTPPTSCCWADSPRATTAASSTPSEPRGRMDREHFVAGRAGCRPAAYPFSSLSHSRLTMNRRLGFLLFLVLGTLVGCQQADKQTYANVKGTVTFNGQPVEKGQITFALEGRPPSTMDIVDGKFSGQAMVGSNKVSISAKRKTAAAPKLTKDAENQT